MHNKETKYIDILEDELKAIGDAFEENELAYLALTSKVELPIRDKIAYKLYRRGWSEDIIIAREWLRSDLAILHNNAPLLICELKAAYTFDPIYNCTRYLQQIESDIKKSKLISTPQTEIVALFLNTHIHQEIDEKYRSIIKYYEDVNSALQRYDHERGVFSKASEIINNVFLKFGLRSGKIRCGNAYNYDVEIYYWMFYEKA